MKRIISFLLVCLLLTGTALAVTVREQVSAPAQVPDACQSNTGKTRITIDAAVHVPDAAQMYLIPVTCVAFDDSMLTKLGAIFWPGIENLEMAIEEGNEDQVYHEGVKQRGYWKHCASLTRMAKPDDDIHVQIDNRYYRMKDWNGVYGSQLSADVEFDLRYYRNITVNYDSPYMQTEVMGEGIDGHPLTSAQAIEIGKDFIRQLTDEPFELYAIGVQTGSVYDKAKRAVIHEGTDQSYALAFTRVVADAPLLFANHQGMSSHSYRTDLYTPPVGYEQIVMAIDREGRVTCLMWMNPYAIGEVQSPQTLMPFDHILDVARQIMPLKYQWREKFGCDIFCDVTRIDLGYMALLQRDKLAFALTPVWNFYGRNWDTLDSYRDAMRPLLTINAVDGTVVDLDYGY